jgi:septal ring factor EnvC (AmiA/AmiB activator)
MIKPTKTVAAILTALFSNSEKAISEKLTQEEFNAFATEAEEVQNRLEAQATGNQAVADELTTANAALATAQAALTTAQTDRDTANAALATANGTITTLTPKAAQWDAYKASLTGAVLEEDATNGGKSTSHLSATDHTHNDRLKAMKAKHPLLMADVEVVED